MGSGRSRNVRVGDPEREAAIRQLGEHLSAGRLDVVEYDERCGKAAAARVQADLADLFTDLPAPAGVAQRRRLPTGLSLAAGGVLALLLVVLAKQIWLLPVLAVCALVVLIRRR